ncbi:MAG: hypothetical protein IPL27_20515 [Lewinellaceae bacterium]|nr:hypothetical protein [Lewinellaceae bacterium]
MNERTQTPKRIFTRLLGLVFLLSVTGLAQVSAQQSAYKKPGQVSTRIFNARDGLPDNKVASLLETRKNPFRWAITKMNCAVLMATGLTRYGKKYPI